MTLNQSLLLLSFCSFAFTACSSTTPEASVKPTNRSAPAAVSTPQTIAPAEQKAVIPTSYRDIHFPEFQYVAPHPKESRVVISDSITGYVIEDRTLPLIHLTVFFRESTVPDKLEDQAALDILSTMFRRGGAKGISAKALDDSLEFISADISGDISTFESSFSVDCLSKNFPELLPLAKKVFLTPAFEKEPLEIQKKAFVNAYEHRYDTPGNVLGALHAYVNYRPHPRLWDANDKEYKAVSQKDLVKFAQGKFAPNRIIFAISGDFEKDSMVVLLKKYFAEWNVEKAKSVKPLPPLEFVAKPGIYVVNKDITQANISMSQPFVKRPHPDYYPAAVASFILGGGSFSSRLTTRVRSDEGLAYSVQSSVENDYYDVGLTTISLQTKVESAPFAMKLIFEEIQKLAKEGPTAEELSLAKKSLIESLPSLFDSPENTTLIFAEGEMLGKSFDHYLDYVKEINAITPEQIKAMIAKYFDPAKMSISIVGPADKLKAVGPFTLIPLDSLDFRR